MADPFFHVAPIKLPWSYQCSIKNICFRLSGEAAPLPAPINGKEGSQVLTQWFLDAH